MIIQYSNLSIYFITIEIFSFKFYYTTIHHLLKVKFQSNIVNKSLFIDMIVPTIFKEPVFNEIILKHISVIVEKNFRTFK